MSDEKEELEAEEINESVIEEPIDEIQDEWGSVNIELSSWKNPLELDIGDKFIMLLKDKDENNIFIGQVSGINPDDGIALFIDDLDPENILQFTTEGLTLILKTTDYEILDFSKIKDFDLRLLSEDDKDLKKRLTKEVLDEIEIDIYELEKEERTYSKQECKESLLSDIIQSYSKNVPQEKILEDIDIILSLVYGPKRKETNKIPNWLIPLIDNELMMNSESYSDYMNLYNEGGVMGEGSNLGNRMYSDIMRKILHSADFFSESDENTGIILKDHEGKYYRDCLQDNSCLGVHGAYSFDERKNNKIYNMITDYDEDSNPIYKRLRDPQHIHTVGLLYVPDKFLSFIYDVEPHSHRLNLYEKCIYGHLASYNNLRKRQIYQQVPIMNKVVTGSEPIEETASDSFVSYSLGKHFSKDELNELINNLTPSMKQIYESLDDSVKDKLLNYDDIRKVCLKYDLLIENLNKEDIAFINKKLTHNTNKYSKIAKNIKYRKSQYKEKKIPLDVRIRMAKDLILSMINLKKRNDYIQQFITLFCKEPELNQEKQWLYNIYDNEKILCKHYHYLAGNTNSDKFLQMKQLYGLPPQDGNIYCKNCGEYICNEEFSLYEGFSDNKPSSSKYESLQEEDEPFSKYDDKYEEIILLVKNIGLGLGVSLEEKDIVLVIDMYDRMNEDLLANKRYLMTNVTNTDEHPRVKEILKKNKKDKDSKKKRDEETKHFQKFLKNTNRILGYTSLIMIIIQTGIPAYKLFRNLEFNLYEFQEIQELSNYDSIPINNKTVDYCIYALKKCAKKYKDTDTKINWSFYEELLSEEKNYSVSSIREQFINILRYCLTSDFPLLQERIIEYHKYYLSILNKYTKYEWELYKPLTKNIFIDSINEIMNKKANDNVEQLLTYYNSVLIQNVTMLRELNKEDISELLSITPSDMMIQESFKRLFKLSVSLYGKTSKPNFAIDSNILHFIQNSDEKVKEIFKKNGWNDKTNTLGLVSFKNLRTKTIPQIISHYSSGKNDLNPCFSDEANCNTYIHMNVNNYGLSMLNVNSKRFYIYKSPVIFPEGNYEEISDQIKEKLFKTYCKDPSGDYVKRVLNTDYLYSQILDISPEVEVQFDEAISTYEKDIKETEENFFAVIYSLHSKGILQLNQYVKPHKISLDEYSFYDHLKPIESRFLKVFSNNDYDNENLFKLIDDYLKSNDRRDEKSHIDETWRTEFKEIFSDFNRQTEENLDKVSELANECFNNEKDYRKRFESIFTKSDSDINLEREDRNRLEGIVEEDVRGFRYKKMNEGDIRKLLVLLTDDPRFTNRVMIKYISHIRHLLSILKRDHTTNTRIPNTWRLQQVNKDFINNYLSVKCLRSHGDLLKNKVRYDGFYSYKDKDNSENIFSTLYEYCSDLWNDLDLIQGSDNTMMNNSVLRVLSKGIFIKTLLKIGEIGALCRDNDINIVSNFDDDIELDEISEIYDKFFCDILIDAFECFYDTKWTESNTKEILSQRLAKQYEREKQSLISNLDKMSDEQRHASTELQKMGVTNWFKNSDKEHMEHIQSENYDNETLTERYESMNEIFSQNRVELDAMNFGAVSDELLNLNPPGVLGLDGGLMDVEEEGYDVDDFDGDEDDYEYDDNITENSFNE